jgi:hypothetical protein
LDEAPEDDRLIAERAQAFDCFDGFATVEATRQSFDTSQHGAWQHGHLHLR